MSTLSTRTLFALFLLLWVVSSVAFAQTDEPEADPHNTLTDAERRSGWKLLFDGQTTRGWRGIYRDDFPDDRWTIQDGNLMIIGQQDGGGAIITEERFRSFELVLEFKIEGEANSGIKYFVTERDPPTPGHGLGLEYQIWDDNQPRDADKKLAALYDLIIPNERKQMRPLGEFNQARILVRGDSVEHWLNGARVLAFDRSSDAFRSLVAKSKYDDIDGFARAPEGGHILLQDEGGHRVWFRNIKIRRLTE